MAAVQGAVACRSPLAAAALGLGHAGFAPGHGSAGHSERGRRTGHCRRYHGARRTIEVPIAENMGFLLEPIDVRLGETVRPRARSAGKVMHEFVIGTQAG